MGLRKTICPNHGVIENVELGAMWMNGPPKPANYCTICGERTIVEYPEEPDYTIYTAPTADERSAARRKEIEYYRKKYWHDRKFE